MELNGWTSPQMLGSYGASARSPEPAAATTASWTAVRDRHATCCECPAARRSSNAGTGKSGTVALGGNLIMRP